MISLLIGVGALFLAVIASAIVDPWPSGPRDDDDCIATMNAVTLSV